MRKPLTLRILSSLDSKGWLALGVFLALALVLVPLLHLTAVMLAVTLVFASWLVKSKFGRVLTAIRDAESRVMFIGYNPL